MFEIISLLYHIGKDKKQEAVQYSRENQQGTISLQERSNAVNYFLKIAKSSLFKFGSTKGVVMKALGGTFTPTPKMIFKKILKKSTKNIIEYKVLAYQYIFTYVKGFSKKRLKLLNLGSVIFVI